MTNFSIVQLLTFLLLFFSKVWQHIDNGSCPGQGIGVRTRLENGISGFIHIKNISDKPIKHVEERIEVQHVIMRESPLLLLM